MREIVDKDTGAILFKKDSTEKKVEELEKENQELRTRLERLEKLLSE